jgi:hypothetical protein
VKVNYAFFPLKRVVDHRCYGKRGVVVAEHLCMEKLSFCRVTFLDMAKELSSLLLGGDTARSLVAGLDGHGHYEKYICS